MKYVTMNEKIRLNSAHNIDISLVFTGYSNSLRDSTGEIRDSHDISTPLDGGTVVRQFARHAFLKVE